MQKFRALGHLVIAIALGIAEFSGLLSPDLTTPPYVDTSLKNGLPIRLMLKLPEKLKLKAVSLAGKSVEVRVQKLKKKGPTLYEAELTSIGFSVKEI